MKHTIAALLISQFATPLMAQCPAAPDHSERLSALIVAAQVAPSEAAARKISDSMWELWADAPDEKAQDLLDFGMSRREIFDFDGALQAFEELVAYCPDYAEGYNQRAFVNYLREEFDAALVDLDAALLRSPRHIAAIAGKGLTLLGLGREEDAQTALRDAVSLNPWLSERHLLKGDMPVPKIDL
jgi:tetratricopeptide (TPR) repeat protein